MKKTEKEIGSRQRTSRKDRREAKKKKLRKRINRTIAISLSMFILLGLMGIGLIRVGIFPGIQEFLVTSAMTTMSHKYIANIVASDDKIQDIMKNNKVVEDYEEFDESKISTETNGAEWDKVELKDISRDGYTGYMLIVNNPKRVFLGTSNKLGEHGSKISQIVKDYDALGGVNAGGFSDANGKGGGGTPTGLIIENGEIKYIDEKLSKFNIIGFNNDNILVVGRYTLKEIKNLNLKDAVDFRPFLIVNGKPTKMYGNGGWGVSPRTAIGQRADGTVLFVVIDGRQIHSMGASMRQLQEIMVENGAVNAANLDGGSSSVLYFEDKIINRPSSSGGDRYLPSAFLINKDGLSESNIINNLNK